jgi:hypothetical protein
VVDLAEERFDEALAHATAAQEAAAADDVPPAQARADLVAGMARQAARDPLAVDVLRAAAQRHAELGLESDRLECLSVLAVALRDAGDLAAAVEVVEEVLPSLEAIEAGTVEPGRVLADVHLVLSDAGDPRAAAVAERAAVHLRERAARIADDDLRTLFLTAPVNVRLAAIARTD